VACFLVTHQSGARGSDGRYLILECGATEKAAAAFRAKTWGEYAEVHGKTWGEAYEDWELEFREDVGGGAITPDSEFDYGDLIIEDGWVLPDPREVAYSRLIRKLPWEDDEVLARTVTLDGGSPFGHLRVIAVSSREGVERIMELLKAKDPDVVFREDDELAAASMGIGP